MSKQNRRTSYSKSWVWAINPQGMRTKCRVVPPEDCTYHIAHFGKDKKAADAYVKKLEEDEARQLASEYNIYHTHTKPAIKIVFGKFPLYVDEPQTTKHLYGHNNYKPPRSIITLHLDEMLELLNKFAGTGTLYDGDKEVVDFGVEIGYLVNRYTGKRLPTTRGTIHYNEQTGAHIVPAMPKNRIW